MTKSFIYKPLIIVAILLLGISYPTIGQGASSTYLNHPGFRTADSLQVYEKWAEAIRVYADLENEFKRNEDWENLAAAINRSGWCHWSNGDRLKAKQKYEQALEIIKANNNGWHPEMTIIKDHQADLIAGINPNAAIGIYQEIDSAVNLLQTTDLRLTRVTLNYANLLRQQDISFLFALDLAETAVKIQESFLPVNHPEIARGYHVLGEIYYALGRYSISLQYVKSATRILDLNPGALATLKFRLTSNTGNKYFGLSDYETAALFYRKTIGIRGNYPETRLINAYNNLATSLAHLGQYDSVEYLLERAIYLNRTLPRLDLENMYNSRIQQSDYYLLVGEYDMAYSAGVKALEVSLDMGFDSYQSGAKRYISIALLHLNEYDSALGAVQDALILAGSDFEDRDPKSNPEIDLYSDLFLIAPAIRIKAQILYEKYLVNRDLESLQHSNDTYLLLEKISDQTRNGAYLEATQLMLARDFKAGFAGALQTSTELYTKEENDLYSAQAFRFMEKSRYLSVYANLSKIDQPIADTLREKEKRLNTLLGQLTFKSIDTSDSLELAKIDSAIFVNQQLFNELKDTISRYFPSYYSIKFDLMAALPDVQAGLKPDELVLEYFVQDSSLYVLSIDQNSTSLTKKELSSHYKQLLIDHLLQISKPADINADIGQLYGEFQSRAFDLFEFLIPEIPTSIKRIIISPDGLLSSLPFETLLTSTAGTSFKNAPYLIRDVEIQYEQSLNLLYKSETRKKSGQPRLLAFAYSQEDIGNRDSDRSGNAEIPGTAREISAIEKIFSRSRIVSFIGAGASESEFKKRASDFEILHLALHGFGDTLNAQNSRLEFKTELDSLNDGKLYAHEIYNLDLNEIELAVLSACETGIGKDYPGEGVFSVARGFSYAGCPSVLMSLWRVQDTYTAELMGDFYSNLSDGLGISHSLREAKLSFIESGNSRSAFPYFWSGFVAIGDPSPVFEERKSYVMESALAVFIVLIVIGVVVRNRKSQAM